MGVKMTLNINKFTEEQLTEYYEELHYALERELTDVPDTVKE